MRIGTTPKHEFTIPFETELIKKLKITYTQDNNIVLEKYLEDCVLNDKLISVTLTQEDTFKFRECTKALVQLKVKLNSGEVLNSDVYNMCVSRCLDREVL